MEYKASASTNQTENPLDKKEEASKTVEQIYNEKDKAYLTFMQGRLLGAKNQRNSPFEEWNGKTYSQIYTENEKIANTVLEPKKNLDDVVVSAGTIESKLDSLLANINNLDLSPEVYAFDRENK